MKVHTITRDLMKDLHRQLNLSCGANIIDYIKRTNSVFDDHICIHDNFVREIYENCIDGDEKYAVITTFPNFRIEQEYLGYSNFESMIAMNPFIGFHNKKPSSPNREKYIVITKGQNKGYAVNATSTYCPNQRAIRTNYIKFPSTKELYLWMADD